MELTLPMKIYKICDAGLWKDAEQAGTFHGAGIDIEDGYIHFSTAAQLPDTARLHYHNRDGQLLITVIQHCSILRGSRRAVVTCSPISTAHLIPNTAFMSRRFSGRKKGANTDQWMAKIN